VGWLNIRLARGTLQHCAPSPFVNLPVKPVKRLGEVKTPSGTRLELFHHDGAYLIKADGVELMSTRRHLSEDRLAEEACRGLRDVPRTRVLIGGLGLGFTLRAALKELASDAEVVVAELMREVIEWNANPEWGISSDAMADPRVRIVHDDVFNVLAANASGFDAIMLDTDNGPDAMLMAENGKLYADNGIAVTKAALRAPGVVVYWAVGDDPRFLHELQRARFGVETLRVRAHSTAGPLHVLYVAKPKSP
jgi:spermidine synthase